MAGYTIGQSGIQFGGGAFSWAPLPNGTYGWVDQASGRQWDPFGNPVQAQLAGASAAGVTGPAFTAAPSMASGYTAPGAAPVTNTLAQNQGQADQILAGLPDPQRVNVNAFNKLPTSAQQFVLSGYEAKGYSPSDVTEQFQKMLPTATGVKRGYIAPLGA